MRFRIAALAALPAILLLSALPPGTARAQACKPDGPTLVCAYGGKNYRVIENTVSPSKRFAIAWLPAKQAEGTTFESDDDSRKALFDEPCENYIVRLSDGEPLRKTTGTHFGDREHYNHRQKIALWSPDERWLMDIEDSKWSSDVVQVYRFSGDGMPGAGLSLLAPLRKAALGYLARQKKRIAAGELVDSVQTKAIADDGTVALTFIMQVPKKQSYAFDMTAAMAPNGDAVRLRVVSMDYDSGDID
jgi:hypothetical protein